MSFSIEVTHQNPNIVSKKLGNWSRIQKEDLIIKTINNQMEELYKIIYRIIPVKTGYMRSTLGVQAGDAYSELFVAARYAGYVEKGTTRNRAHPFFVQNVVSMR